MAPFSANSPPSHVRIDQLSHDENALKRVACLDFHSHDDFEHVLAIETERERKASTHFPQIVDVVIETNRNKNNPRANNLLERCLKLKESDKRFGILNLKMIPFQMLNKSISAKHHKIN